jgi:hypothetical protein
MGDVVTTDSAYPSTSLSLLSRARRVGHFSSGAHLEARLFPDVRIDNEAVPLTHLRGLPGAEATYRHMLHDPLDRVITYDDTAAGLRLLDAVA